MKSYFFLLFTSLLGLTVSGCNNPLGCTEIGCQDGVDVTLAIFTGDPKGTLPLFFTTCIDGASCSTAEISNLASDTFECTFKSGTAFGCSLVEPDGDVIFTLPLTSAEQAKTSVTVSVSVTDSTGAMVFEGQKSVTVETSTPNGPDCEPTCHQGKVTFTS